MRALFGGDLMLRSVSGFARLNSSALTLTFYDAQSGGAQVTDLLDDDGVTPLTQVVVTGGTVPAFYGPDGVVKLWADAGDGTRELMRGSYESAGADDSQIAQLVADPATDTGAALSAAIAGDIPDPATPIGGALSATIDRRATPSPMTGSSPIRAGRLHLGRALALTQGGNYSAFPGIAQTASGRLVVAYRSANGHLSTDGAIVVRTSDDRGATWTAPAVAVANAAGSDKRDATLAVTPLGLTLTYFTWDGTNPTGIYYTTSADEGETWGAPVALPAVHGFWDAVTAPMIELTNGDLLVPIYGRDGTSEAPGRENCVALISPNGGASWTPHTIADGVADAANYEEPYVQQLADGTLLALIRKPTTGYAWKATSTDNGRTWSAVSQAFEAGDGRNAHIQTTDGTLVVFTEATTTVPRPVVRASYDQGATWTAPQVMVYASGGGAYAQAVETSPGVLAVVQATDGHSSKADVSFRYVTVGPRVTPLGDTAGLNDVGALHTYPHGLIAWDTFDRADEANMNYSLADSGHQWRTISGTPVLSNRAMSTNTNGNVSRMVVEAGTPDVDMTQAWEWGASVNLQALFRVSDANNYLMVQNTGSTTWKVIKREAGVETDLSTVTYGTPNYQRYVLRVVCKNNRVRVFIDGDKIIDLTLSTADQAAFGAYTLFGISTRNVEHWVRSFVLAR